MKYEELILLPEEARAEALAKAFNEKNTENKSLRDRLKKANPRALELYDKMKEKFGVDDIDDEMLETLYARSQSGVTLDQQVKALTAKLEKEKKEKEQLMNDFSVTKRKSLERERDTQVMAELGKVGVRGDAMVDAQRIVSLDAELQEDGAWLFAGKSLSEYMVDFAKAKAYLLGNPFKGGSSDSSQSNGGRTSPDFISEAEYLALSPEEQRSPEIRKKAAASMDKWGK